MNSAIIQSWITSLSTEGFIVLLDASIKGFLLLAIVMLMVNRMKQASAASRHFAWSLGMAGLLALPLLSITLPSWQVQISFPGSSAGMHAGTQTPPKPVLKLPSHPFKLQTIDLSDGDQTGIRSNKTAPLENTNQTVNASYSRNAATVTPQNNIKISWKIVVFLLWMLGTIVSITPFILGLFRLRQLMNTSGNPAPGWIQQMNRLRGNAGMKSPVRLVQCKEHISPMNWGLLYPVIALPESAQQWSPQRLDMVLQHELAHVQRKDCLMQAITQVACAIYWFNPLIWLVNQTMRIERERACDDYVISNGTQAKEYASHLLDIARSYSAMKAYICAAVPMARISQIEIRLRDILDSGKNRRKVTKLIMLVAVTAFAFVIFPLASLHPVLQAEESKNAIVKTPENPSTQDVSERISELVQIGDQTSYNAAAALFKEAQQEKMDDANAWLYLVMALYSTGEYENGLAASDHYINLAGGAGSAEGNVGVVWKGFLYDLLGKRDKAKECYQQVLDSGQLAEVQHDQFGIVMKMDNVKLLLAEPHQKKELEASPGGTTKKRLREKMELGYCFDAALAKDGKTVFIPGGHDTYILAVEGNQLIYKKRVPANGGYHRNIKVSGDFAYIADIERELVILDITNPQKPTRVCNGKKGSGMGLFVRDHLVYEACGKEGLKIFDVSNPTQPSLLSTTKTQDEAWDVWVKDDYAYIADLAKGMAVVDVKSPASPKYITSVAWAPNEKLAEDFKKHPEWKPDNCMTEIIRGSGNMIYIAAGIHGLVAIDISDPLKPRITDTFKSGPEGFGEGLAVEGNTVYLANGNNEEETQSGLYIINVSDSGKLHVTGKVTFGGWVEGVYKWKDKVFASNTNSGVQMIDVSQPQKPSILHHWYGQQPPQPPANPNAKFGASFKNISESAGIRRNYNTFYALTEDFDRDGMLDIYLCTNGGNKNHPNILFHNNGNMTFADVTKQNNLYQEFDDGDAAIADFNNDGIPDILTGNGSRTMLYRSQPDGTYQEVAESLGMNHAIKDKAMWLDIDNDNNLDFITIGAVYRNDGKGGFKDITATCGLSFYEKPADLKAIDFNRDNKMDLLFLYNDTQRNVVLARNNGDGTFSEATSVSGLDTIKTSYRTLTSIADVNNDGFPDILFEEMDQGTKTLYINDTQGHFIKSEKAINEEFVSYGSCWGDFDNDTNPDLYFSPRNENKLFKNNGNLQFDEVAYAAGLREGYNLGHPLCADFNNDGFLDLLMPETCYPGSEQEHLFQNLGAEGNSLTIVPLTNKDGNATDPNRKDNRTAVGARVEVMIPQDSGKTITMTRWITAGEGNASAPIAYFGLGKATKADVTVTFPDETIVVYKDVDANSRIVIKDR